MCNKGTKGHNILVPREESLIISTCLPPLWVVRSSPYSSFHQYLRNFLLKLVHNFVWDCSNICLRLWQPLCSSLHHFEPKILYYISVLKLTADTICKLLPQQLNIKLVNVSVKGWQIYNFLSGIQSADNRPTSRRINYLFNWSLILNIEHNDIKITLHRHICKFQVNYGDRRRKDKSYFVIAWIYILHTY